MCYWGIKFLRKLEMERDFVRNAGGRLRLRRHWPRLLRFGRHLEIERRMGIFASLGLPATKGGKCKVTRSLLERNSRLSNGSWFLCCKLRDRFWITFYRAFFVTSWKMCLEISMWFETLRVFVVVVVVWIVFSTKLNIINY